MKNPRSWFLIFTGLLIIYTTYIGLKNVFRYNQFKIEYKRLQQQSADEAKLNQTYKQQEQAMQVPGYWELQAKKRLGWINPGEQVIKLVFEEPK